MEEIDDISRMKSRIEEEIIHKLDDSMLNIIIFDVTYATAVLYDEFEDLSEDIFNKNISSDDYNKISVIVMLEGKYLKNLFFKGLINPFNKNIIPEDIIKLFNLSKIDSI